jgi:hypothetical protein
VDVEHGRQVAIALVGDTREGPGSFVGEGDDFSPPVRRIGPLADQATAWIPPSVDHVAGS